MWRSRSFQKAATTGTVCTFPPLRKDRQPLLSVVEVTELDALELAFANPDHEQ